MTKTEYTTDADFDELHEIADVPKKNVKVPRHLLVNLLMDYGCLRASEMGLANRIRPILNQAVRPKMKKKIALDDELANL